jgi:photosystem II stability/assembly factor-like uncharacterized protein
MKNSLHFLFFVFLVLSLALAGCGTPRPASSPDAPTPIPQISLPLVESPNLWSFYFMDESLGWGTTETKIVRTNDGGVTWYDATPPGLDFVGYSPFVFLDAQTAWVLNDSGTLYHTANGGSSWTWNPVPFSYASLQFLDASNGFAMADLGAGAGSQGVAIYKTNDGGAAWQAVFQHEPGVDKSLPLGGQKYGFTFLNVSRGWIGGSVPVDNYIYLYATQDGGATWDEINLLPPAGYESAQTGNYAPIFFSATDGILPVNMVLPADPGIATVFFVTRDGGQTWTPGQAIPNGRPASLYSANDIVAWGGGSFYVSHDGGQTWGSVTPDMDFNDLLSDFQFVTADTGWALTSHDGTDTSLYRTSDGGATWALLIP